MRSVPRLCEFNPGVCLTTEEKQGKTSVRVVKECCYPPYPHPHYYISLTHPYSTKPTHTQPHTLQKYTRPHGTIINIFRGNVKSTGYPLYLPVQSTTGSRSVCISGSNAGYTMFRGSVKSTGYPLYSPVSPSLPLPCVTVCHQVPNAL